MSEIQVNTINEYTGANGVTIDGVLLKDNKLASGTGNVLQVVTGTDNSQTDIANTSYQATGLSASITPSSTSSKILVLVSTNARINRNNFNDISGFIQILRDTTEILERLYLLRGASAHNENVTASHLSVLDSPNSTSSITYSTKGKAGTTDSGGVFSTSYANNIDTITLIEIGG
jgi:hypothetical protein